MDPISNMLIMMKNAGRAGHKSVVVPYSGLKNSIAECLEKEGYLVKISKKTRKGHPILELEMAFADKDPKIKSVKRISKQSRRIYFKVKDIRPVKNGQGILVLSTPKGILSGESARKEQVGGEALFQIW